jgi:hypothetical protein
MYTSESAIWLELKRKWEKDYLPIRIENVAATSLTDVIVVGKYTSVYIELKAFKSGKTTIPKYQYAFGAKLSQVIHPHLFWIIASYKEMLIAIRYDNILGKVKPNLKTDTLTLDINDIKFDILHDPLLWLDNVMKFIIPMGKNSLIAAPMPQLRRNVSV